MKLSKALEMCCKCTFNKQKLYCEFCKVDEVTAPHRETMRKKNEESGFTSFFCDTWAEAISELVPLMFAEVEKHKGVNMSKDLKGSDGIHEALTMLADNKEVSDDIHEAFASLFAKAKKDKKMSQIRLKKEDFELIIEAVNESEDEQIFKKRLKMVVMSFWQRTVYRHHELQTFGLLLWEMVCAGFEIIPPQNKHTVKIEDNDNEH